MRGGAPAVEQAGAAARMKAPAQIEATRAPRRCARRSASSIATDGRFHDVARSRHDDGIGASQCAHAGVGDHLEAVIGGQRLPRPFGAHDDAIPVRAHPRKTEHLECQAEFEGADAVIGHHRDDALRALRDEISRGFDLTDLLGVILVGMIFTLYGIRATGKLVAARFTLRPGQGGEHDVSGWRPANSPTGPIMAAGMWRRLAVELGKSPVDLLVLPELAGVDSFWSSPTFDEAVWRQAAALA